MAAFRISIRKSLRSFTYAFNGLREVTRNENNFRFHLLAAALTLSLAFHFPITTTEWLFIILFIGLVTMAEVFNTALEKLVDWQSPERNPRAGQIKDMAAGAVMLASVTALAGGMIIFYKYFVALIL
ncbi:MAG: diacylglycerol kinase family protein [Cytophagales bacterium]|nr:diacylglycerol kinase family protein [Cytophagales bacterium]